jgi:DNA polymerase III subunit alpha
VNKRALESLAAAGAFDCLEPRRARAFSAVDAMLAQSQRAGANAASGQMDMLGGIGVKPTLHVQDVEEWLPAERLNREYDAAGSSCRGIRSTITLRRSSGCACRTGRSFRAA